MQSYINFLILYHFTYKTIRTLTFYIISNVIFLSPSMFGERKASFPFVTLTRQYSLTRWR